MTDTNRSRHHGFTLIELLMVAAIIGILISICLPAVGLIRAATRKMTCQSNMRQMFIGIMSYSNDWQGRSMYDNNILTLSGYVIHPDAWPGTYTWGDTLAYFMASTQGAGSKASKFGIFNCPENKIQLYRMDFWGPNSAMIAANRHEECSSYSGNGYNSVDQGPEQRFFGRRLASLSHISELMVAWEGVVARTEAWNNDGYATTPYVAIGVRAVRYAHRGKTNILYADGHTGDTTMLKYWGAYGSPEWRSFCTN